MKSPLRLFPGLALARLLVLSAAQLGVTAPVTSATSVAQAESLVRSATLDLSSQDLAALESASRS